jgi:thymidylate synthase
MPMMFSGETANDVWDLAAKHLIALHDTVTSRSGDTYELLHALLSISDPKEKWVSNRIPAMSISFALAELIWILNGSDTAKIINYWNSTLSRYAGHDDNYNGAYGFRIRRNFGVDQLEKAYCVLHNKPESRQTVILIWDPKKDLPKDDGSPSNADIPCNICSMLKVRNNKLEWTQIMRSNDVFLGLPYNFIQFTSMQEILAGWLEIGIGNYTHYSDSLHLYTRDCNKIEIGTDLYSRNADSLSVSKNVFDMAIKEIYNRMQTIVYTDIDEIKLGSISYLNSESEAYNNIMRIISAYAARKKGFLSLKDKIIKDCSNPLYIEIWNQWEKSQEKGVKYHE